MYRDKLHNKIAPIDTHAHNVAGSKHRHPAAILHQYSYCVIISFGEIKWVNK